MQERFSYHVPNLHADDSLIMYEMSKRRQRWKKVAAVLFLILLALALISKYLDPKKTRSVCLRWDKGTCIKWHGASKSE